MEKIEATLKKIGAATSTESTGGGAKPVRRDPVGPGDPDCPHCHGVGYIREEAPLGHPNFGKLFACSCRLAEIESATKQRRIEISSLGPLQHKTFEAFRPEGHAANPNHRISLKLAYETAQRYAESPRGWLLLHGSYGCGKTHLAAAIANARLAAGQPIMFVNAPDLLDHLRATFGPGSEVSYDALFDRVRNIPLLIIDDLGAESPTPWAQEKLYQIFNHRYNAQLPTVVTSNVELERIEPRLRSRLVDMDLVRKIVIDAPDFRRADSDQTDISSLELHRAQTFEAFETRKGDMPAKDFESLQDALAATQDFAEDPHGWLVLTGPHGCGKTHLAAAVANRRIQFHHQPAVFITGVDLLDHLRATFSPDSTVRYDKRFAEIKSAPLLVLDDLALASATVWAREKLMQLLDYRYVAQLPTVVTTAMPASEFDDWLTTRLLDPRFSRVCKISATIYKGGKATHRPKRTKPHAR